MISKTLRPVAPVLASALALMLAAGAVQAQTPAEAPQAGDKRPAPFVQLDTDKDGNISRAEWDAPRLAALKAMDPDADGVVTLAEMKAEAVARATARAEAGAERRFARLDADGDGRVTAAEAMMARPEGPHKARGHGGDLFARLDADKDGTLTTQELDAARKDMRDAHRGPGKGPRGDRGHGGHDHDHDHDHDRDRGEGRPGGADKSDAN